MAFVFNFEECDSPTPQNQEWIFNVVGEETFDVVV